MKIGAQFYTLREQATNLDDFAEALKRVADIGYTTVQISGVCEYEPEWLKQELDRNDLECVLTHWNPEQIKNDPMAAKKAHDVFGCKYIGVGSMPGGVNEESLNKFVAEFKDPAKTLYENGAKLFYHNHHWEFSRCNDGEKIMDKILSAFPKEHLGITMDTFWVQYAGADSCYWLDKMAGRVECIHLKDMSIVGDEQRMAPVGHGNMDFEKIIAHASDAGAKYLLVEQDHTYGEDPFKCLEKSYKYLKSLGLK